MEDVRSMKGLGAVGTAAFDNRGDSLVLKPFVVIPFGATAVRVVVHRQFFVLDDVTNRNEAKGLEMIVGLISHVGGIVVVVQASIAQSDGS